MEVSTTFTLSHDSNRVFAFLIDHEYQLKWVPNLVSVSPIIGDPNCKGAKHTMVIKEGRKNTEYEVTRTEIVPGKLIRLQMDCWGCGTTIQKGVLPGVYCVAVSTLESDPTSTEKSLPMSCFRNQLV